MDNDILRAIDESSEFLEHWGIKGMRWGVRRYQNKDGSLTPAGEARKKKILQDPKLLAKHRTEFTDEELSAALKRFQTERQIRDTTGAETNYQKRERKAQEKAVKKLEKQRAKDQEKANKERMKEQAKLDEERAKKESKTLAGRLRNAADIAGSVSKIASASGVTFKNGKDIYNALTGKEDKKKEAEKAKEKQKDKSSGGSGGSSSPTINNIINILGDKDKMRVETSGSESQKSKSGYDVSKESVDVVDGSGLLNKSSWKTMSGDFDQRVVGKHTQYGKILREHYGDDIVDNGGKMYDALFPPMSENGKWDGGDITNANFDDIPWPAIMKNVKG